ncbi:pentapeptide repeat-containing protein [Leptolyngbya sp. FACHB-671]|uniref:NACHT domain-containing protein n=1 Tax=Leptolyngbya sp. FACHB-671 TaxID=2692812 RepID=UPI001681DC42|nr:pentapeptide repeat-containing protein [Leptolyngbya sp. FACHB-671]MBD2068438.1 pentapeptide repeat-containing protein [Leptolyngbya sp. FACHB-671]
MATRIWKFLTTDIKDLFSTDTVTSGVDAANAVFGLAEALQDAEIEKLAPQIARVSSLLDVLNLPLAKLAESTLPFVSIATGLLKFYLETTQTEPSLAQSVGLVSQAAYLESFRAILVGLRNREQLLKKIGQEPASEGVQRQIRQLGELEIDDKEARRAIAFFHESKLAKAFNEALTARLTELGIKPEAAIQIAERVARNTDEYMLPALINAGESVKQLVDWYRLGGREVFEKYFSIDSYLSERIQRRPLERVFDEQFSFRDIYVPLKAQLIQKNGEPDSNQSPVQIEQWARQLLNDVEKGDRVLFIQGGPGRGKSVFCRMFADWVRQHEHPRWTPILIRLRDVRTLEKDFEETLRKAIDRDFAENDPGWLTDRNIRFLFLLDGFDELLMEGRTSGGLEEFLRQVGRFQESCAHNSEKGHRILVTGRSLSLQSIERLMPPNLERVELLPMDDELQGQWLAQWGELVDADPTHLKEILHDPRLPDRVQELTREPLLLYLLAAMHRDGELRLEMFEAASEASAKVLIYQKTLDWVLTKQRPELLNRDLTELETEGLHRILAEAGLCVVQSGGESAAIAMIEERLKSDDNAKSLLEAAQNRLQDSPLRNALSAFYMESGRKGSGFVEFTHKSFSEFLCAERLKEAIEDWSKGGDRRREFYVPTEQMDWEIYDLLGYGGLTPEIVEYLMVLLIKNSEFDPICLFNRLENFYLRWYNGEFIDAPPENLPQRKMRLIRQLLRYQSPTLENLGQRQIDTYVGLNVIILLSELHRYAQTDTQLKEKISFYLCGQSGTNDSDRFRLLRIISWSYCIHVWTFKEIAGKFLKGIDLSQVALRGAYLIHTNFEEANLEEIDLRGADLRYANFYKANLRRADLSGTNLSQAILIDADLSGACLAGANLSQVIVTNKTVQENWKNVRGLETVINLPENLKQQLRSE